MKSNPVSGHSVEFLTILLKGSSRFNSDGGGNSLYCTEFELLFYISAACECLDGYGMCDCPQHFDQIWPLETASLGVTPGNKTLLWKLPEVAPRRCGSSNNTNRSRWNTALVGSLMTKYIFARGFMIKAE